MTSTPWSRTRARGLSVLMDVVPCHTSIRHPWFREHPEWYIWADRPNNWRSAFGGSAWTRSGERYYLHSFYPEQPDLDWRNPAVVRAMQEILRFWLERGAAGYRVDAIDRLLKDPQLRDDRPPASRSACRSRMPKRSSRSAIPATHRTPRRRWRRSARPSATASWSERCTCRAPAGSYLETFDAVFASRLLHAPWDAPRLREAIAATTTAGSGLGPLEPRLRPARHALPDPRTRAGGASC